MFSKGIIKPITFLTLAIQNFAGESLRAITKTFICLQGTGTMRRAKVKILFTKFMAQSGYRGVHHCQQQIIAEDSWSYYGNL